MNKKNTKTLSVLIGLISIIISSILIMNCVYALNNTSGVENNKGSIYINNNSTFFANGTMNSLILLIHNNTFRISQITGINDSQFASNLISNNISNHNEKDLSNMVRNSLKSLVWGPWDISVVNGKLTSFGTEIKTIYDNAENFHTHNMNNFKSNSTDIKLNLNGNTIIHVTMDIGLNGKIAWKDIKSKIIIAKGKVLTLMFDDNATGHHFNGQSLYGLVDTINGNRTQF
jgi:hypothetical protein